MGKKRTFLYEGTPVDVDDSAVNDFLSKFPKAEPMESFVLGNDTVDVPASDISVVEKFKQQYPDAKPLFGEEQPQEIPTITLDSTEVAEGTAEAPKPPTGPLKPGGGFTIAPKPPTGPLKPGGGFTIGKTPTLTKQTKDVFVKNFLELPDNLKLDARNSGVFVNTFAKKMNLSPRELRQVANETVKTEVQLKQLKTVYDQNPDDTDTLYKLAELHNNLGQHDLAYEAYAALEGKLKTIGEKEYADRISKEPVYTKPLPLNFVEQMPHANRLKSSNLRPDYVEQRQLPAVAGMAYTQELLGNKAEAQRLKGISESRGYKGQEFSSVGAGEALQPGNDMVYNDQGQMVPVGSPTPESEYLNGIAQAIENFTLFGPANEMTNVGFDKLAKNLPGAFDPYGLPSDKIAKTVGVITGAVETLMGVAGMTTPAGALFAMPLVQAQNIAPEQAKWMMPLGVVLNEYYRQQGEKMPEMMENVTVLADLGLLGFLTHQGVEGAKGLKAEIDLKKVFENLPPEAVEQLAKVGEKRIEMAQGDPKVYGEQMALRLDELKPQVEEIKMQAEAAKPVEPYNPPPHPESLRTVEEGSSIIMNGEEGILERSDDGSWNFTTDKKSTQIPVADKFNPTETLKELGIEVLAEITPEQVARATADAEQVGRVEMNGKEYFVSLDRVGNENPTGDFVLEVKPDGTMINRFDSHPDPTFAKERKLKVINTFLESKGLPKRDKLTSTKLVEETPTQEKPSTLEIKPIENEKANQEGREKGLLDTPPLEQPLAPVAEKPTPNEPVSPAVEVQPVKVKDQPKAGSGGVGGDVEATTKALEVANNKTPNLLRGIAFDNKSKATPVVKEVKIADILEENKDGQKLSDAIVNVRDGLVSKTQGDVMLYEDGSKFGVDDGFHRIAQAIINGDKTIKASVIESNAKSIAEAYHKAKADGTNPKLVKAVEQSLKEKPPRVESEIETKTETPSQARLRKKNELLEDLDKYNSIPKKERGEATNLSNEIQAKAKEQGFSVSYSKKGDLIIMNEKGQRMKKSHVKLTPEQKVEVENRKKEWTKAMGNPVDLRQLVLQYLIKGGNISWDNLGRFVGYKNKGEYPAFVGSEKGARLDDLWTSWIDDPDLSGLISEDSYDFANQVGAVIAEFGTREQMHEALREYGKGDNWREMGFNSEHQYESALNAKKLMQELGVESIEDVHLYEAMEDVANMTDMEVEQALKDLDNNFPKTEQEIQKWYEEHGIEAEVDPRTEVGSNERIKAETPKGEVSKAPTEGELVAEAKPDVKPTEVTPAEPLKITSKEKALKAVDDLESFLLNLPGIKDNVGGERMGAPFSAEEAVKFFAEALREGVEQGYKVKEAIERAIGKLKEHKTYKALLDSVDESMLRDNARKNYEKQGVSLDKPIEQQFGASHASVAEVRKAMGIEDSVPISERVKRDVKTVMEEGRELASKIDIEELSDQVIYDGRSLNANEQAALVFRETELYNEIKDAENSLSKAVASGKKDAADLAQTRIDIAYKQQTAIMQALDIAGSEMGLAFRMRQVMNKRDYSLVSLEKRWTQASGGAKMPADVRKQFSDMVKDLEAKNKRYEELLEVKDKQLAEQALANIQESMGRSGKPTDKVKVGEKLRRLADRIEAGKISRLGGYKTSTGFDAVYDLSLTAVAETLRATGKLADAIESGIKKIRETDWYKDLADKNDFETKYREHLNKEYEKTDYDAPSMNEKGDLILDNQMLRDVVESLEVDPKLKQKNPQEFIDKVHEIVKEVFPDIERRKVQDAISGYGKKINSSIDDLQRELNSLKRDAKGISGLEDARAGKGVLKSGYSQPKPTDMQREQQREIHKELKKYPQDQASLDKKWATALDRTKSALKNSITDLTKRIEDIKAGTATPKTPREKLKLDNEAEMMQEVVDDLKQQLIDLEGKKTLSIEQRIDMAIQGAERTRELYERRTKEIRDTGTYTRDTPVELSSPELTIARQIRDAAKAVYEATRDASPGEKSIAEQTKAARDLRASEDRVKDLENKIKKNQIGYAAKAQRAMFKTPELIASLAKEKVLKEVINTMREEQGLVEAHARDLWKARKQRQIAEIERRIREKDYTKKVKPELELDIEMERIQAEMDRKKFDLDVEIEKEKYRNLSGRDKRYEMWLDIVNAPKSLMASMDFSAPLRQGAILSSRHPLLAAKTFKNMFKHWASEEYATNWHSELVRSDGYIRAKKSNLFISEPMARLVAAEERFSSNIAEKIPVWGRGVKASNRAYSGFLNELRMEVFNQHYEALQRNGFKGKQMQKELDAMAYLINNFTGRGSLGKAEIAAPLANSFFFAPRFVASRFNTLYNSLFGYTIPRAKGGGRLITPRARIEAYKAVGSYITAGMSVIAMAKAAGADVEIDPRSSDFGKIKIGDTRYDIWAGHQQIVVLLSKIAMQASKSPRTGKVTEFGENDNAAYTTLRFLRTKLSPPVGALVSAGMKKNVDGTPFTAQGAAWDMITPLIFSDMKSMYEEEGAVGVLRSAVPATFGVGVNTFEKDAIIKQSNLDKSSEKLMLERKYQPQDYKDDEVYVKGKPYIIPEDKMVKIKEMRAKEAGKLIELHYWKLKKLTPEEYESKVNSYYNEGLKKARNKYLPSGWKNTK